MSDYSTEGPQCPRCGHQYTADEPEYYDEMNYTEETCDSCGTTFEVEVYNSTSWTCTLPDGGEAVHEQVSQPIRDEQNPSLRAIQKGESHD